MPGPRPSLSSPARKSRKISILSYAKVNLYLEVHRKRADNYHELTTLFERISLHDTLILKELPQNEIRVISDCDVLPQDSTNLAYKSAQILKQACKSNKGVEIRIIKRIPIGAGLAGGSSNAASALMGLNKLWSLGLSKEKLISLAKKIGSDVAFFIEKEPFGLGKGRGEKISLLPRLRKVRLWHVLVVPKIHVSTPFIYKKWDNFPPKSGLKNNFPGRLTISRFDVKLLLLALAKQKPLTGCLFNSLEAVTVSVYPEVGRIKKALKAEGMQAILMSGSGPAVFGIAASKYEALHIAARMRKKNSSWLSAAVQTA